MNMSTYPSYPLHYVGLPLKMSDLDDKYINFWKKLQPFINKSLIITL
jgi:hypothetical protein